MLLGDNGSKSVFLEVDIGLILWRELRGGSPSDMSRFEAIWWRNGDVGSFLNYEVDTQRDILEKCFATALNIICHRGFFYHLVFLDF